jgi:hypothetical protein
MARDDFYASPFGVAYSAYVERPGLSRLISRVLWGGDTRPYYDSMGASPRLPTAERSSSSGHGWLETRSWLTEQPYLCGSKLVVI